MLIAVYRTKRHSSLPANKHTCTHPFNYPGERVPDLVDPCSRQIVVLSCPNNSSSSHDKSTVYSTTRSIVANTGCVESWTLDCYLAVVDMLCCRQVLEVLSAVRNEDPAQLADTVYKNTCNLFNFTWRLIANDSVPVRILSVFPALIVHSELNSVHPGFPVAFIF